MDQRELSVAVHEAVAAVSAELRSRFQESTPGVGFVAMATLRHLARNGPRTVTELALADQVSTQAISLRVRPLLDAGLATRAADPADARRTVLTASTHGRRAVARAEAGARVALSSAISRLEPAGRTALSSAVPALLQLAEELSGEAR